MDYGGDWFYNPGLHWELIHRQEEEAKAAKKEKEERERRREERKEARLKMKNEQQQTRTENGRNKTGSRKEFDEEENAFDLFVNFVKEEILVDKPATPKYLSISEYAKSKNRQVEDVKVRSTTTQPPTNMHPELTFVPTQRTARTRESSGDPSNISNTFGTRNFIPAFMGCVAFISLTMILFAVCRWFLYRTSRKRLRINNSGKKTSNPEDGNAFHGEGCKLNTFEPSAPAELELEHCIVTPGVHTRQEGNRFENSARVITDFRLKYQTAVSAKRSGNSKSLMPLLEHVFGRGNECENCRQPFNSQRCHANFNNRM